MDAGFNFYEFRAGLVEAWMLREPMNIRALEKLDAMDAEITRLRAENERLREKLDKLTSDLKLVESVHEDYMRDRENVLREACDGGPDNRHHCTCVHELRALVKGLTAERDAAIQRAEEAEALVDAWNHGYEEVEEREELDEILPRYDYVHPSGEREEQSLAERAASVVRLAAAAEAAHAEAVKLLREARKEASWHDGTYELRQRIDAHLAEHGS